MGPWPADLPYVSIYSRRDGIVDWRACLDPAAEHVEVDASHCGMAAHGGTYEAIAAALRALDTGTGDRRPGRVALVAIPDEALAVLESDSLAHLVTLDPDGAPQVSCVWVGVEDGEICCASLGPRRKIDNVRADPRVALSIEGDRAPTGWA